MTKKQVRECLKKRFGDDCRIVDIDIFTESFTFVNVITISRNHVVWKNCFEIVDGEMVLLETKLLR